MNWKTITDLEGLPESGNVLVAGNKDMAVTFATYLLRDGLDKCWTHWCLFEPPKPMTDEQAYSEWYDDAETNDLLTTRNAWHAALAWERNKK